MPHPSDYPETAKQVVSLLYDDAVDHPTTLEVLTALVTDFIGRLHGFTGAAGFAPETITELEVVLTGLFGPGLRVLRATSIHSNRRELKSYRGYWEDPRLGGFFKRKNREFLATGGVLQRVYACDSLADVVSEAWFAETVLAQVNGKASVKVVEIDPDNLASYEDFGVYEHVATATNAGSYLLLAPAVDNRRGNHLRTRVTPDEQSVTAYTQTFERMWAQSLEPLEVLRSPTLDEAAGQAIASDGVGTVNALVDRRVILRKMRRLDTGDYLLPEEAGFVRKYERRYAAVLRDHIRESFPGVAHILYVGDTYQNDGAAIRNLQALDLDVSGFICEPQLDLNQLWFNSVLYSSRWTDIIGFVSKVLDKVGPQTLGIFDIDQTLWAPKGVLELPLTLSRTDALEGLVDTYMHDTDSPFAQAARARVLPLYRELAKVKYHKLLTMDNEDYKAALCVFLALNLVWDAESERGDIEVGVQFLTRHGDLPPDQFVARIRDRYLPLFMDPERGGLDNMTRFMTQTLGLVQRKQYSHYGETNGVAVQEVNDAVLGVFRAMGDNSTVKYEAFRLREYEEALRRATEADRIEDSIVINRPAWDLGTWLKTRGVTLLALSDRPDEATSFGSETMLDAEMTIYGRGIAHLLP